MFTEKDFNAESEEYDFESESEEFKEEVNRIVKTIFQMHDCMITNDEDRDLETLNKIAGEYQNPSKSILTCEEVAADNLCIRRMMNGATLEEVSELSGVPVENIKSYENGKRCIVENKYEFLKVAVVYGYCPPPEIRNVFVYGYEFYEAFKNLCPDLSTLTLFENPFESQ